MQHIKTVLQLEKAWKQNKYKRMNKSWHSLLCKYNADDISNNITSAWMNAIIKKEFEKSTKNDTIIFYYSGHGTPSTGQAIIRTKNEQLAKWHCQCAWQGASEVIINTQEANGLKCSFCTKFYIAHHVLDGNIKIFLNNLHISLDKPTIGISYHSCLFFFFLLIYFFPVYLFFFFLAFFF